MKQIPIIRFSQFDNKWSSIAIGNLAQIKRGASPRPIQDPKWFDKNSDIGWLRISDVTEQNGRIKYLEQKISKLGQEKTRVLNTPHLLLSIAATVGKPVVNYVKTGVHDGFLIFENPKFDREFMFQWFDMFRPKWNKYGQPGSQVNLNSDIIRNHKMMIPSLAEQSAIGYLFRILDDLLTSYKDNLTNYQSLKATMLSKMFPKAGHTVPEIRLDGFEGEWVEKCIGELADIVRGASPRPIQDPKWFDSNSEIGWLRISDVTSQNGRIHSLEQKISNLGQEKTRVLTAPHLLLSIAATVGKPVINYVKTGVHDGFLIFMNPKFDREFMFQWLEMFREKWNRYGQPGSQVNLNSDIVKNQKIFIPSIEEQCAIGSYFSKLDNLINSHQEKITLLETLKKKLLQDMFI
ncbi:restriction endonuclease subunit S [Streptococcus pseudopneumoniae]|uniref:restriction endonuclease subunit S n=1 Tax=Streptococcus pseudopneumoniae TaxID=257758 RepID=UPI00069F7A89|nr:restriction endonuclease subunit S [Streptococcus pseudopneumoniae]